MVVVDDTVGGPLIDRKDEPSIMCVAFGVGLPLRLSEPQKATARDIVRDLGQPLFVHSSDGVSDATPGYLFVPEKGDIRCMQTTYGKAKKVAV